MSKKYEEIIVTLEDENNNDVKHKLYEYNDGKKHIIFYPTKMEIKQIDIYGFTYEELIEDGFFEDDGSITSGILAGVTTRAKTNHLKLEIYKDKNTKSISKKFRLNYQDLIDYSQQYRNNKEISRTKNMILIDTLMGLKKSRNINNLYKKELLGSLDIDIAQAKFNKTEVNQLAEFIKRLQISEPELIQGQIHHGLSSKLEETIKQFDKGLKLAFDKNKSNKWTENKWKKFLGDNIWILNPSLKYVKHESSLNSSPDKNIDIWGISSKGTPIVYELKLPKVTLLEFDKSHNTYYWTKEATKALSQADGYYNAIIKRSDSIYSDAQKNIKNKYSIDISQLNLTSPKVYLVIGSTDFLVSDHKNKNDQERKLISEEFQRLRQSLKNVEIITFDELLEQLKGLKKYLTLDT